MIISRTPFRISLVGGGTDYPSWYQEHGGAVIGTTIDKYCYLSVSHLPPYFEHKYRIIWSKIEDVKRVEDIQHPVVRALIKEMQFEGGLEISYRGDIPARSGLGTSSAFTVGLINALYGLLKRQLTKNHLAWTAIEFEQNVLKEAVGSQDQIHAAYGGFNYIEFLPNLLGFEVTPMDRFGCLVERSLMLFFTGFQRDAHVIAEKQISKIKDNVSMYKDLYSLVRALRTCANTNADQVDALAFAIRESWNIKKRLADGITNEAIDRIYARGIRAGAIAGKLLGAGGGGFMLFVVPDPEAQKRVIHELSDLIHVPFMPSSGGSQIIVNEP